MNTAGYDAISVLSRRGKMVPMRVGFYRDAEAFVPNVLLSAVEPPAADVLELKKLSAFSGKVVYHASRNRQCHTYALTERRDTRSLALKRVFSRYSIVLCPEGATLLCDIRNSWRLGM